MIKRIFSVEDSSWLAMRQALWPQSTREEHLSEMGAWCADHGRYSVFLAYDESGQAVGFAEAAIRSDYVNGTETSPVGFLEGLYVVPDFRRQGAARALVTAVEAWVVSSGCGELASDTDIGNSASREVHRALGFEETERVVFFRKKIK